MSSDTFSSLGVPAPLVKVLADQGIDTPTPIQAASLPDSIDGADVLGRGRTGSGKTLAFLIPLVVGLDETRNPARPRKPRSLVLAPTRELALQIHTALQPLAKAYNLSSCTVFGGVGQNPQVNAIRKGMDVVVACPGRLEDLMGQGHVDLSDVEITILDEADHMADLGFLPGVTRILRATPKDTQRMLFSATLDSAVQGLVDKFMHEPMVHEADSAQSPVGTMDHHVLHVADGDHQAVLTDLVAGPHREVVFTRTKHRAKRLARKLNNAGVPAVELHGNLSQNARTRNLDAFHSGHATVLVATDIAARGIHVDHVGLVIHADPPVEHKAYLHRSGRTARAGESGTVVTLMTDAQVRDVRDLTRKAGVKATTTRVTPGHPLLTSLASGEGAGEYAGGGEPVGGAENSGQRSSRGSGRNRSRGGRSSGRNGAGRGAARGGDAAERSSNGAEARSGGNARRASARHGNNGAGQGRSGAPRQANKQEGQRPSTGAGARRRSSGSRRAGSAAATVSR